MRKGAQVRFQSARACSLSACDPLIHDAAVMCLQGMHLALPLKPHPLCGCKKMTSAVAPTAGTTLLFIS